MNLSFSSIPENLATIIEELRAEYPLNGGADSISVIFEPGAQDGVVEVSLRAGVATIRYDTPAQACRGLGSLLSGTVKPGEPHVEQTSFTTMGIMLDCSRNAVMAAAHFQGWLRRLALLGYNMAMLYTEDKKP